MTDQRLLVKLSKMYYDQNLSQKDMSEALGISRPQISRLLQKAREENIVSIKINDPNSNETALEEALISRYRLKDALVLNTSGIAPESLLTEFGRLAVAHLEEYISSGDVVGVMSGRTIAAVVQATEQFSRRNLKIVPLVGGLGSRNAMWHANAIAQMFAAHAHSTAYTLNAPSVMQSEAARDLMITEPDIRALLKLGAACDVAIVGIGQVENSASNVLAGALNHADIGKLKEIGAVGSMCISYFDNEGTLLHPEIETRMIGQSVESIRGAKTIALAIGADKAEAIRAALKTEYVDVFITNVETAHHIIDKS